MKRLKKNERGAALLEAAITIPIILLVSVGIFEFGRAYQTWQVLTNAAREGARLAVIDGSTDAAVTQRSREPTRRHRSTLIIRSISWC
jgi:Flp pilus assembly protein TadG